MTVDWSDSSVVLNLLMAKDWNITYRRRVAINFSRHGIIKVAVLASLEAVSRTLRKHGWTRDHTSFKTAKGHAGSRYYFAPNDRNYRVRISDHLNQSARFDAQYIIDAQTVATYNALGMVQRIERDYNKWKTTK